MQRNFLLILIMMIFTGCGNEPTEKILPPPVKVIKVSEVVQSQNENYAGIVRGRYESNLAFQTGGRIISRAVEEGTFVHAGEILMEIDSKDAVQQLNAGKAQVESARTNLNLAKSNFERYSQLFNENAISAATLDQYKTNYENALANYSAAVAQANQISNNLSYTKLIANADGVISKINAEIGQVVAAGQTVLTLVQTEEFEVEINIPENKLAEIEIGKIAEISFWANSDKILGSVREISPVADSSARTYKVRISIPNPRNSIYLGMTASANFSSKNLNGVILPLSAIYQTENQAQVWIVTDENKTALKNITVENFIGNEVLVSGLNVGEIVITAGVHKLREGQEVRTQ